MGFGGFISSVCSVVSSACSAICSGISSLCSSIGGALSSAISTISSTLVSGLGIGLKEIELGLKIICAIVSVIAEAIGIKKEDETPEELAMQAEQSDKKPEDFDSINQYIEYLRENIKVDKEKLNNLSEEEKCKYQAVGTAIYVKGIEEKYDMIISPQFLIAAKDLNLSGQEVKAYMDNFKKAGITDMDQMLKYLKNDVDTKENKIKVDDAMVSTLKELNPEMSDDDIFGKLNNMSLDK